MYGEGVVSLTYRIRHVRCSVLSLFGEWPRVAMLCISGPTLTGCGAFHRRGYTRNQPLTYPCSASAVITYLLAFNTDTEESNGWSFLVTLANPSSASWGIEKVRTHFGYYTDLFPSSLRTFLAINSLHKISHNDEIIKMAPSKLETISFDTFTNIVDGAPRSSKQKYHGIDPTTKKPNWDVPVATSADIDDAVRAANTAFASWKLNTWAERTDRLVRFKEALEAYTEEMTDLLLKETGKPRMFAAAEVGSASKFIQWHIDLKEPKGEEHDLEDRKIVNKFVPLGVAAAICPWNFPLLLSLGKVLPAVQMGNAIIVKPSPFTPCVLLFLLLKLGC